MSTFMVSNIKQRDSNIELLRIVLMVMIVGWHYTCHGMHLNSSTGYENDTPSILAYFLYPFVCYKVNCFVFISGFYGIQFSNKKLANFLFQLMFYSCLGILILLLFAENPSINIVKSLFPFSNIWWFAWCYLELMLFSPFLNKGIESVDKNTTISVIVSLGLFGVCGFPYISGKIANPFLTFIFMYLIGRYARMYDFSKIRTHALSIWLVSLIVLFLCQYIPYNISGMNASDWLYASANCNPFNILAAISFFYIFKNIRIHYNAVINFLSLGVFSAYLLTDGVLRDGYNNYIVTHFHSIGGGIAIAISTVILISSFDMIRRYLFNKLYSAIINIQHNI